MNPDHPKKTYTYHAYGRTVKIPVPCPELLPSREPVDVEVEIKAIPWQLKEIQARGGCEVRNNTLLLEFRGIAGFTVYDGAHIVVDPHPGTDIDTIRSSLFGPVMGAIMLQRGFFVLHGSVVEVNGKAVLFSGVSGSGKSTLGAFFFQQGFPILSDDVCVLRVETGKTPMVYPAVPYIKLMDSSLSLFGEPGAPLQSVGLTVVKHRLPIKTNFQNHPLPLTHIYELRPWDRGRICLEPMGSVFKVERLLNQAYWFYIIEQLGIKQKHFEQTLEVVRMVDIVNLYRPDDPGRLIDIMEAVLEDLGYSMDGD